VSRRVLVTGAGSGFGRAMAARFVRAGDRVLVSDVDGAAAATVAKELGELATAVTLDVTSDASWADAIAWCEREWDGLDILINNAGVGAGGRIEKVELADWDWIWDINVMGLVRGIRGTVPIFKRQRSGHIVNIASLAAIMNLPGMAPYNVTKGGVVALSETLRYELEPYNVATTVVCPGFVRTNLTERMRTPDPAALKLTAKLMDASTVTADDVAEMVFAAVRDKRFMVLTHKEGRQSHRLKRFLPRVVDRRVREYWARLLPSMERGDA